MRYFPWFISREKKGQTCPIIFYCSQKMPLSVSAQDFIRLFLPNLRTMKWESCRIKMVELFYSELETHHPCFSFLQKRFHPSNCLEGKRAINLPGKYFNAKHITSNCFLVCRLSISCHMFFLSWSSNAIFSSVGSAIWVQRGSTYPGAPLQYSLYPPLPLSLMWITTAVCWRLEGASLGLARLCTSISSGYSSLQIW